MPPQPDREGLGRVLDRCLDPLHLVGREWVKDVIRHFRSRPRRPDADPEPNEFAASEDVDDASKPFVPPVSPPISDPRLPHREAQVIDDHEEITGLQTGPLKGPDRLAAQVYVGLRHDEEDFFASNRRGAHQGAVFLLGDFDSEEHRQRANDLEAEIVSGPFVLGSRISNA